MSERRAARASPDEPPRTLEGRYELAEVIGRGGMGTVYRAVDLVLGRPVAVKTLPWLVADQNPNSVARFEREARAAAALSHPGVVAVYDTGVDASMHFIVMELVAGRSLEAIVRDEAPLEPDRAAGIAERVADALAAAHAAGIVHRDIKPANVMVAEDGSVKVLDFGIAREMGANTLTQTSSVLGTAAYMAPEQAEGKPADERSDIYALGCVLYALLAGHPPFEAVGLAAILHQQANTLPAPPRDENRRVSPALSALVMEMLAKSPADRPRSATEVRSRLRSLAPAPPKPAAPTARLPGTTATRRQQRPVPEAPLAPAAIVPSPARRRLAAAGALAAVVLVITLVALASGGSSPHRVAGTRHAGTASTVTAAQGRSPTTAVPATKPTTAPAKRATTATGATAPATAPRSTASPRTTAGAAGALHALTTRGVQSGAIDPQAGQQIATGLASILNSWQAGKAMDAQHQVVDLSRQVTMLVDHGQIASAAAPAIVGALANLGSAVASAAPASTHVAGTYPPDLGVGPPGREGLPPGRARHFGKHRYGSGD